MPERSRSYPGGETSAASVWSEPGLVGLRMFPLAYPLDEFYVRAGRPLPAIEMAKPEEIPEPQRSLLVHHNDMTPTLAAFHASTIELRVLSRELRDDFYFREVVLLGDTPERPVEFGAIRINLALFAPAARRHILDERAPLGHLLRAHGIPHTSHPKGYFRLVADALMKEALKLEREETVYGRRNTLLDAVQRPLAEVVEILPAFRGPGP
jgi:hypothetical protein